MRFVPHHILPNRSSQAIQPVSQQFRARHLEARPQFLAARAQVRNVDARGGQFAGVADEPLLDAPIIGLGVELQGQGVVTEERAVNLAVRDKGRWL